MQQLSSLQAVRAIAAIFVVVFHINIYFLPERLYNGESAVELFNIGYAGVEFFFALSGFIMVYIHQKDIGTPEKVSRFALKRVLRIYPLYWVVLTAFILAMWFVPSIGASLDPTTLEYAHNYSLFPVHTGMMLEVAWTLQYEMLFYIAFGLLIFTKRFGLIAMGIWFSACAITLFRPIENSVFAMLLSPNNLIFLCGMLSALYFKRLQAIDSYLVVASGLAIFFAIGIADLNKTFPLNEGWRTLGFGIGASLTIMGLVAGEAFGKIKSPAWLNRIGDSSYALYLVHLPVLMVFSILVSKLGLNTLIGPLPMLIVFTIGSVIAGLVTHYLIEKPLIKLTQRLFFNSSASGQVPIVKVFHPPLHPSERP
ncbi:acyltransferase family protein [Hirschia litorea]|uniref:Acyltransferase family protein n=1 Tax=Hirschia litorea TaxID=1199156 RepID=A0ABW2IJF5_9PROT